MFIPIMDYRLTSSMALSMSANPNIHTLQRYYLVILCLMNGFLLIPYTLLQRDTSLLLNRPVYTHEFANPHRLIKEWLNNCLQKE